MSLISDGVKLSEDRYFIRSIVQRMVMQYIEDCTMPTQLFAFGSDNGLYRFRRDFMDYYVEYKDNFQPSSEEKVDCLVQFNDVFNFIQESIDFHALHEKLSIKLLKEIKEDATKDAIQTIELIKVDVIKTAEKSVEDVKSTIEEQVEKHLEHKISEEIEIINEIELG